jgi:hypothetical protein
MFGFFHKPDYHLRPVTDSNFTRFVNCIPFLVIFSVSAAAQTTTQAPPAAPSDPAEGGGVGGVQVGPLTLSGGTWVESLFVTGDDPDRPIDTFRIRRARLGLAGNVAPKIGWSLGGEFSGLPSLRVAFVLFRLAPYMNLRIGQATPPGGLERSTNPLTSELIERSRLSIQLTNGLDVGLTMMSERPIKGWVTYAVSVVNGAGFNRTDDNRAKDVVGRFRLTPPAIRGLIINVSGATGEQPLGTRRRSSLGVQYDIPVFKIGLEGIRQTIDENPSSRGVVVYGAWRIRPLTPTPHFQMLEFGARYYVLTDPANGPPVVDEDGAAPDTSDLPQTIREVAVGVNYNINGNVRLMGNVIAPVDDRPTAITFLTRLQLVF